MKQEPKFRYDQEAGVTICQYEDKYGRLFLGTAMCAPEDEDVKSEFTGYSIAEYRAKIDYARTRKIDALMRYEALRDLYYSMQHSSHYNPKSYEARRIKKHYMQALGNLKEARVTYQGLQTGLRNYIDTKEKIANKYRSKVEKFDSDEKK